jgi:hypothetical protein
MDERYLDRREASAYLSEELGLRVAKSTLQKFATVGGGPRYRRWGNRAVYSARDLDQWASAKLSAPRYSTSEAPQPPAASDGSDENPAA